MAISRSRPSTADCGRASTSSSRWSCSPRASRPWASSKTNRKEELDRLEQLKRKLDANMLNGLLHCAAVLRRRRKRARAAGHASDAHDGARVRRRDASPARHLQVEPRPPLHQKVPSARCGRLRPTRKGGPAGHAPGSSGRQESTVKSQRARAAAAAAANVRARTEQLRDDAAALRQRAACDAEPDGARAPSRRTPACTAATTRSTAIQCRAEAKPLPNVWAP